MKIEKNNCLTITHEQDMHFKTQNYLYDIYRIQMRANLGLVSVIFSKDFITVAIFGFCNALTEKVLTFEDFIHFIEKQINEKITFAKSLQIVYDTCFDYFIEVKGL